MPTDNQNQRRATAPNIVTTSPDPTYNVGALVEAAVERLNDLREAESRRINELMAMRAEYEAKLAAAEKGRIDSIRAVDVNAVAVASQRASDQATVLASQVAQSADALRLLVASTATTVANAQQQLATTLDARLTKLEQAQYVGQGRAGFADPAMKELIEEVAQLRQSGTMRQGQGQGMASAGDIVARLVAVVATLLSIGAFVYSINRPAVANVVAPASTVPVAR